VFKYNGLKTLVHYKWSSKKSRPLKTSSFLTLLKAISKLPLPNLLSRASSLDLHLSTLWWENILTSSYKSNIMLDHGTTLKRLDLRMSVSSFPLRNMTEPSQKPTTVRFKDSSNTWDLTITVNHQLTRSVSELFWKSLTSKTDGCTKVLKLSHLALTMFIGTSLEESSQSELSNLQNSKNSWQNKNRNGRLRETTGSCS